MRKFLKWTGFVVVGVVAVALAAFAWLYLASERVLARTYTATDPVSLTIPGEASEVAQGYRIAQLAGCLHCHGDNLTGGVVDDIPNFVRLVAPNISTLLPAYSDAQLATMLRKGVKPDGHSVLFMPSEMFRHLGDADLARLIAWLRTMPAIPEGVEEKTQIRIIGRLILANGDYKPGALAIESLPAAVNTLDANDPVSHGRYLTMNFCSECHGQDLQGFAPINAPALSVAKGYSPEQFTRLMHDGVALGDRELKLMGPTSRARFASFTPDEAAAVHAFLRTL